MGDNDADRDGNAAAEEGEEDTATAHADESSTEEDGDGDDTTDDGADDEGDGNEPDDEGGDGKGKGKGDEDDDDEPPTRKPKTPADFVAMRRGKKLAKLSGKGKGNEARGGAADEDDEDDDGLSPEDAAAIDKRLEKHLAPILAEKEQKEVDTEIANFISDNPEFKPYAAKVAKWAGHEAYKNVALEQIFYAAAGKELLKIGAKRKQAADGEARKGRTGGGSNNGDDKGSKDWHGASHEDVGKEIERVKLGGR